MRIEQLKPVVKCLGAAAPEPAPLCWIIVNGEEIEDDFCEECAQMLVSWSLTGNPDITFEEHTTYPPRAPEGIDPDEVYYCNGSYSGYESCGPRFCGHCGAQLDVTLLYYGVQSVLDEFEHSGIQTAGDWRLLYAAMVGIEHVEQAWFPGSWMSADLVEKDLEQYRRVVNLVMKHIPAEDVNG